MRLTGLWIVGLFAGAVSAAPIPRPAQTAASVAIVRLPNGGLQPQVAVDAAGRIHVVYFKGDDAHGDLFYTRLNRDGQFSPSVQINTQPGAAIATGTMRGGHLSDAETGACGCCGVGALADQAGVYLLYRAARDVVHCDTYLLTSHDRGNTFSSDNLQEWNINACPMSTFSLAKTSDSVLAAWETDGQVQWTRMNTATGARASMVAAPGTARGRKHPTIAANRNGDILLAWTEGTGWNRGGAVAWQLFDKAGKPLGPAGRMDGVPVWGLTAAAAGADGRFIIIY